MKRVAMLLLLALSMVATPAVAQDTCFLLGFTGYDYEDPNPDPANYLAIGDGYHALGFVTSFGLYIEPDVDPVANEYTFHYYDLVVQARFFDGYVLEVMFADPGRGRFYEDSRTTGTAADYGVDPPNATAPSTFTDGVMFLGGCISTCYLAYDFTANQGNFSGQICLDEGTLLDEIPVAQRDGWTLSGLAGPPNETVPQGYDHQLSGECYLPGPTPATHKTWGALKALYR